VRSFVAISTYPLSPRADHANYLANWIEVLRHDKRAIFTAASKAEQTVRFLHGSEIEVGNSDRVSCIVPSDMSTSSFPVNKVGEVIAA
jgi:antirestriction protein ArdC